MRDIWNVCVFLAVVVLLLFLLPFRAAEAGVVPRLAQAPRLPQAPYCAPLADTEHATGCRCTLGGPCTCENGCGCLSYADAWHRAVHEGKLFVCFVGCKARPIKGAACCRVSKYDEVVEEGVPKEGPCIVVAEWRTNAQGDTGCLRRVATLSKDATDEQVLACRSVVSFYQQPTTPATMFYAPAPRMFLGGGFGGGGCGRGG